MIAIKDMLEMPSCCGKCKVRHECKVADEWDEFDWNYNERCEGCPLVEIVTCKDCKHCDFDDSDQTFFCNAYGNIVCSSHFCSNGERRK